jgi:hypothetical protein
VVVLDEPFTALDADAADELVQLLAARARESLVILADHQGPAVAHRARRGGGRRAPRGAARLAGLAARRGHRGARAVIRYPVLLAARSRAALAPAAAWLFVLAGVYAYRPNDVGGSFAVTAALLVPLSAWFAVALSHAEPAPQRELLSAGRDPGASDIVGAAFAHTGCAVYGAMLGTLASARMVARPGVAFAGLVAFAIAAVPLFDLAPALSPAAWTADALLDDRAVAAPAVALAVHAAAALALAAWGLRRTA